MDEIENEQAVLQKTDEVSERKSQYKKLNKGLLYLLSGELGYFFLMIICMVVSLFIPRGGEFLRTSGSSSGIFSLFPWILIPLFIGFAGNLLGGGASLYLTIKEDQEGFPGTGHLLNWMFIMSTCWIFTLMLIMASPSFRGVD